MRAPVESEVEGEADPGKDSIQEMAQEILDTVQDTASKLVKFLKFHPEVPLATKKLPQPEQEDEEDVKETGEIMAEDN